MSRKKKSALRSYLGATGAVVATAVAGSLATDPQTRWYKSLDKPAWQPPSWAFPVAWTALYASIALASGKVLADSKRAGDQEQHGDYKAALALNLLLNAGWSFTFFKAKRLGLASLLAGALAASSADLSKRAGEQDPKLGWALKPYAAWTSFATALSTDIWRRNR
ncbi:tryptophan-rich sensory protein [Tessaracoccus terricola]